MAGERDLKALLASLSPQLADGAFVFCAVAPDQEARILALRPLATFREAEGLSVVLGKAEADAHGLRYDSVHRCITLQVHSSLEAVGLTAAVSTALARHGLSANVIAALRHDHVFVPADRADEALSVLAALG